MESMDLIDLACWGAFLGVAVRFLLSLDMGVTSAAAVGAILAMGQPAMTELQIGLEEYGVAVVIGLLAYSFRHRLAHYGQRALDAASLRHAPAPNRWR